MVKIGSNEFRNVAFPLAFENRYFMLEPSSDTDVWTVFTVKDGKPIIEIVNEKGSGEGVWLALLHNASVVSCGKASFVWESKGRPLCLEKPLRSETEEPPVFRPEGLAEPAKEAAHRGRLLLRTAPRLCWFMERCFGGSW